MNFSWTKLKLVRIGNMETVPGAMHSPTIYKIKQVKIGVGDFECGPDMESAMVENVDPMPCVWTRIMELSATATRVMREPIANIKSNRLASTMVLQEDSYTPRITLFRLSKTKYSNFPTCRFAS